MGPYDSTKTYVIGGIVDHNKLKGLTASKAKDMGIKMQRFPIDGYMKLRSSATLSINHSFELLARVYNGETWEHALNNTIPDRKRAEVTAPKQIKVTFSNKGRFTFHEDESELRESSSEENESESVGDEFIPALPQTILHENIQQETIQTETVL